MRELNTVVIGGGQAGISVSYYLKKNHIDHLVLEAAASPGFAWREQKWDSFTFVIPNWTINLPGGRYDEMGIPPDEFIARDDLVRYFERYIEMYDLPICYSSKVISLEFLDDSWYIQTATEHYRVQNVFIATGFFQHPKYPAFHTHISADIKQLHSSEYKNPAQLQQGGVLIVGSGQSGMQIADEILMNGVPTYISVGSTPNIPRSYRGVDIIRWLMEIGFFDRPVSSLENPQEKFSSNPQISGVNGGHDVNLHSFAEQGAILLGHLIDGKGGTLYFDDDLMEMLTICDTKLRPILDKIETLISENRTTLNYLPLSEGETKRQGYEQNIITSIDLHDAHISNIIWANGYTRNYDFIKTKTPVTDSSGYPIQERGVSPEKGLYFIGMPWIHNIKSGLLWGVGDDAKFMVNHLIKKLEI